MTIIGDWRGVVQEHQGTDTGTALSDAEKELVVPNNVIWNVMSIWCEMTTSNAGSGVRQMLLQFRSSTASTDVYVEVQAGLTQDSQLTYFYNFFPGAADITTVRDGDHVSTPMPNVFLQPGHSIFVGDNSSRDTDADIITLYAQVQQARTLSTST